jgi:hypothetical protein
VGSATETDGGRHPIGVQLALPTARAAALTIGASRRLNYGSSIAVSAKLVDQGTGKAISGTSLSLWQRLASSPTWVKLGSATTSASGSASITRRPLANVLYQWRFGGTTAYRTTQSASQTVSVAPIVSIHVTRTVVPAKSSLVAYGTVRPSVAGERVYLQRLSGSHWLNVVSTLVRTQKMPNGTTALGYAFTRSQSTRGTFQYRVAKAATASLASGYSAAIKVRVS